MEEAGLTDLAEASVASLRARAEEIDQKIDEIISVAAQILDNFKEQFMERMEKLKEEVLAFQTQQIENWVVSSSETQECVARIQNVQKVLHALKLGNLNLSG